MAGLPRNVRLLRIPTAATTGQVGDPGSSGFPIIRHGFTRTVFWSDDLYFEVLSFLNVIVDSLQVRYKSGEFENILVSGN